jgi:hypothetical protein
LTEKNGLRDGATELPWKRLWCRNERKIIIIIIICWITEARKFFLRKNGKCWSDGWRKNGFNTNCYVLSYMKGKNSGKKMINSRLRLFKRPISPTNNGIFERPEFSKKSKAQYSPFMLSFSILWVLIGE